MSKRTEALARRLEKGALALEAYANALTDAEWNTRVPHDGRRIGVVVHHVATMYPLEIELAQKITTGHPIEGITWEVVAQMNAAHAKEYDDVTKEQAIELLRKNSRAAAAAIRSFSDEDLDSAAPVSLNGNAPLTCQFILEDHAVRHSYHHLAKIRAALRKQSVAPLAV
jgi:hypothetical protein